MSITIREPNSGVALAQGEPETEAFKFEGNWYFRPEAVDSARLIVSDRTYTCSYKGTCNWVDFQGPDGKTVADVAWIYPEPKAGFERIKDRYGFYAGSRGKTREES